MRSVTSLQGELAGWLFRDSPLASALEAVPDFAAVEAFLYDSAQLAAWHALQKPVGKHTSLSCALMDMIVCVCACA